MTAATWGQDIEAPTAEMDRDAVRQTLRNMEVTAGPRAGGRSSSASSRHTLPIAIERSDSPPGLGRLPLIAEVTPPRPTGVPAGYRVPPFSAARYPGEAGSMIQNSIASV